MNLVNFKRYYRNEQEKVKAKVYNAFYKTGFINEDIYTSTDRDIWEHMLKLLSDTNTSTVFENILVAYQEIPYSEIILQRIFSREYKDEAIHSHSTQDVYASINPYDLKFYRCVFIQNPSNFKNDKRSEIINTIVNIDKYFGKEFKICKNVMEYLYSQKDIHSSPNGKNTDKDLIHYDNIVTLVVPKLIDNYYYNTNGVIRFPFLSEKYLHMKSRLGQISFIFKSKVLKESKNGKRSFEYIKQQSFFDVGKYTLNNEEMDIFYVRIFNNFYNPFMFFEEHDIKRFMLELDSEKLLKDEVRQLLINTYKCFIEEYDVIRKIHGNLVPPILIIKDNDSYYDEIRERIEMLKRIDEQNNLNDDIDDCDCDDDRTVNEMIGENYLDDDENGDDVQESELPIKSKSNQEEIEALEEKLRRTKEMIESAKPSNYRLAKHSLSLEKLKALIMGYNDVKSFAYYPHLSDILLKYTDLNDVKVRSGKVENPKKFPKSFQIISTISNDELFCTNDSYNPIDWKYPISYRKSIVHTSNESGVTKSKDINVHPSERYLSEEEFGNIDPHTKKSEHAAGLLAAINPFVNKKDIIKLGDKK